jgi:hypothetical protein
MSTEDADGTAASSAGSIEGPSATPQKDPLDETIDAFIGRLEVLAETPDAKLTCDGLIEVIGPRSHALALLIFSLLNLLPLPPGVNWMLGLVITGLAILMTLDRPLRLWGWVGRRQLPLQALVKLLGVLRSITRLVTRISSPRLIHFVSPRALPVLGLFGVLMGIAMLIPIPLTNMLPAIGLATVSLAILNRDGLLMMLGVTVGIAGLIVLAVAAWLLIALVVAVEDVIDGD